MQQQPSARTLTYNMKSNNILTRITLVIDLMSAASTLKNQQIAGNDDTSSGFDDQGKTVNQQYPPRIAAAAAVPPATNGNVSGNNTSSNILTSTPTPQTGSLLVTKDVKWPEGFHTHNHYLLQ